MTKSEDRRALILDRLADHVLAHGLIASSLRPLAKAAQTSDRMLLYYFADKAEIVAATLGCVAARMMTLMSAHAAQTPLPLDELIPRIADTLSDAAFWPYMRIWLEIASRAAGGDAFYRTTGEAIGRAFLGWGGAQIACSEGEREWLSARLLIMIEGTVLLKSIGLEQEARMALHTDKGQQL